MWWDRTRENSGCSPGHRPRTEVSRLPLRHRRSPPECGGTGRVRIRGVRPDIGRGRKSHDFRYDTEGARQNVVEPDA
jgi:hypothetical protein